MVAVMRVLAGLLAGWIAGAACSSDERPPGLPRVDSGPRDAGAATDAGPGEDATIDAGRRGDAGPRLPPADHVVTLPYLGAEETVTLEAEVALGRLDVHVSVDTTGSFGEEIDAIQSDLVGRIAPALRERVADVAFGVSRFEDFPADPWGGPDDRPFRLLSAITTDESRVREAVTDLEPIGNGGDAPESGAEALWQIATGEGYPRLVASFDPADHDAAGSIGGVGFREGALRAVVHITDAPTHEPADYEAVFAGTHDVNEAAAALRAIDARAIGVASGSFARGHLERLALATNAVVRPDRDGNCTTGVGGAARMPIGGLCPLVFDIMPDGTGLGDTIVDAIADLLASVQYREVYGAAAGDRLRFVRTVAATRATPPAGSPAPARDDLRPPGDGIDDTFLDVVAGTRVQMTVRLRNETVRPADYDQVFRVVVELRGDELVLASTTIRIIIPRGRL